MTKFTIVVIMAALAIVQGFPTRENDIASAAAAGNWDEVHRLFMRQLKLNNFYSQKFGLKFDDLLKPLGSNSALGDVRSLKPQNGGKVYGESEFAFQSASTNEKGETQQRSGGHKIINDNGNVKEFEFQPPKAIF